MTERERQARADEESDIVDWLEGQANDVHKIAEMMGPGRGSAFRNALKRFMRIKEAANEIRKLRELVETKSEIG